MPLRLGIVTDIHLNPVGTSAVSWHNPYHLADAAERFAQALRYCAGAEVDAVAVLGDLAHFGDTPSLQHGVELAAASGVPVWLVPGNHDVAERATALSDACAVVAAPTIHLASVDGDRIADVRLAGLPVLRGTGDWNARATTVPDTRAWGGELVIWLTHYPMLSLAARTQAHGLQYPGDLENLDQVAAPVLQRSTPTLVLHGHVHVRETVTAGSTLQLGGAALIEPPFEVGILDITATPRPQVRRQSLSIAEPPAVALPVFSAADETWTWEAGRWLEQTRLTHVGSTYS